MIRPVNMGHVSLIPSLLCIGALVLMGVESLKECTNVSNILQSV